MSTIRKESRYRDDHDERRESNNDNSFPGKEPSDGFDEHDRPRKKSHRHRASRKRPRSKRDYDRGRNDDDSTGRPRRKHHNRKESKSRLVRKESRKVAQRVDKNKLTDLGNPLGHPPREALDPERDYYSYHQPFWVYLYREEGLAFNDLSAEEAREAFNRFVDRYNLGELEQAYYGDEGFPSEVLDECRTTRHKWSFRTDEADEKILHVVQEGIRKQTQFNSIETAVRAKGSSQREIAEYRLMEDAKEAGGEVEGTDIPMAEKRYEDRVANRRLRQHVKAAEEELGGGRKEGREKQIEKRKERAENIHGAARDRDAAFELSDTMMFGGDDDYQAALRRERARSAQRDEIQHRKVAELQRKDLEKQQAMLKVLGLSGIKPGEKITIKPRND